jgi:hypothetical protein
MVGVVVASLPCEQRTKESPYRTEVRQGRDTRMRRKVMGAAAQQLDCSG